MYLDVYVTMHKCMYCFVRSVYLVKSVTISVLKCFSMFASVNIYIACVSVFLCIHVYVYSDVYICMYKCVGCSVCKSLYYLVKSVKISVPMCVCAWVYVSIHVCTHIYDHLDV